MSGVDNTVGAKSVDYGRQGSNAGSAAGAELMQAIRETADMQMRFQSELGVIQLSTKMNEALAKTLKAAGEAVKGLAG